MDNKITLFENKTADIFFEKSTAAEKSTIKEFLLVSLIEYICQLYDKDNSEILFSNVCKYLLDNNIIVNTKIIETDNEIAKNNRMLLANLLTKLIQSIKINELEDNNSTINKINTIIKCNSGNSRYQSDFIELGKLGSGGFGNVYKCLNKLDNNIYAIKKINIKNINNYEKILKEVHFISRFDHCNIIRYYTAWIEFTDKYDEDEVETDDSFIESNDSITNNIDPIISNDSYKYNDSNKYNDPNKYDDYYKYDNISEENNNEKQIVRYNEERKIPKLIGKLYIQMQLCHSTLKDWIEHRNKTSNKINIKHINAIFKQILFGINYIHQQNLIHGDLKPANLLLYYKFDCSNSDKKILNDNFVIKIADFGLMRDQDSILNPHYGTHLYMPDNLNIKQNNIDIYSLGVIYFELLNIFKTEMERVINLSNLKKMLLPEDFIQKYPQESTIIKLMLDYDDNNFDTIVDHFSK
jgi:serine/threonine protein kinase